MKTGPGVAPFGSDSSVGERHALSSSHLTDPGYAHVEGKSLQIGFF
jgi:hypothetical protein